MTLAMHGAEIEELIAKRVTSLMLCKDVLQCKREFAQTRSFWPGSLLVVIFSQFQIGKESATAARALFETRLKLVREDLAQGIELIDGRIVVEIHIGTNFLD